MAKKSIASILVGVTTPTNPITMPTSALAVSGQLTPEQTNTLILQRNQAVADQQYKERLMAGAEVQARRSLRQLLTTQQATLAATVLALTEANTALERTVSTYSDELIDDDDVATLTGALTSLGLRSVKAEVSSSTLIWNDDPTEYEHKSVSNIGVVRTTISILHDDGARRYHNSNRKDNLTELIGLPPIYTAVTPDLIALHNTVTSAMEARDQAQALVNTTQAKLADIPARMADAKDDLALRALKENDADAAAALDSLASLLTGDTATLPDIDTTATTST